MRIIIFLLFFLLTFTVSCDNQQTKKIYYPNGNLKKTIEIEDSIQKIVEFDSLGNVKLRLTKINGKEHGYVYTYYPDNKLARKIKYKYGKKDGKEMEFYPNSEVRKEIFYKNNKQEGTNKFFYDDGNLARLRVFKKDSCLYDIIYNQKNKNVERLDIRPIVNGINDTVIVNQPIECTFSIVSEADTSFSYYFGYDALDYDEGYFNKTKKAPPFKNFYPIKPGLEYNLKMNFSGLGEYLFTSIILIKKESENYSKLSADYNQKVVVVVGN